MPILKSKESINGKELAIYIEGDEVPVKRGVYDETRGITDDIISDVKDMFGDGLALTRNCAAKVVEAIDAMSDAVCPDEFQIQLSIKLDSEVGAIITKASAGAQLQVTMKWVQGK